MILAAWLAGCGVEPPDPTLGDTSQYPLDDVLRLDHLQGIGTHNSYHVETTPLTEWSYTHAPLDRQLDEQGVRQFELDVYWDPARGEHRVFHVPFLDEGTTCDTLTACAATLWGWSVEHPGHHPLMILVETKSPWDETDGFTLDALDAEVRAGFPVDGLITPTLVQGDHPDLRTALEVEGWPTLGELRGRALFVLHDGGARREAYVAELGSRAMFPDAQGDTALPYAAVHTMNDPWNPDIPRVVGLGHLVRTRADSDTHEARSGDTARRDQALRSGAHFVSTDFPVPAPWTGYVVEVPDGRPSGCNPWSAPPECTARDIEDPEQLQ